MNDTQKEAALLAIEENRTALLETVNSKMDALKQWVLDGGDVRQTRAGYTYPLAAPPALFKGTKPIAVFFGAERVPAGTWKKVYTDILARCISDPANLAALMALRGRIAGRSRPIISGAPGGMTRPVQLAKGLFAETHFDTEWLIHILTRYILDAVRYDYSGISIAVAERGTRAAPRQREDCLACGASLSEPGAGGEPDRLFCITHQRYVLEDGACEDFNC